MTNDEFYKTTRPVMLTHRQTQNLLDAVNSSGVLSWLRPEAAQALRDKLESALGEFLTAETDRLVQEAALRASREKSGL